MKYIKLKKVIEETLKYESDIKELISKTNLSEKDKKEAYDLLVANSDIIGYMDSLKEIYREKAEEYNILVGKFNNSQDIVERKTLKNKTIKISKELEKMRVAYKDLEKLLSSLYPMICNLKSQLKEDKKIIVDKKY